MILKTVPEFVSSWYIIAVYWFITAAVVWDLHLHLYSFINTIPMWPQLFIYKGIWRDASLTTSPKYSDICVWRDFRSLSGLELICASVLSVKQAIEYEM